MLHIRPATEADASDLLEIYAPYVLRTAISFEAAPPPVQEFAARIAKALKSWAWLVAQEGGRCVGYAYAGAHRERSAYQWSVETSAYVDERHHRRGIARALYLELFERLKALGYCNAYAGSTLPNEASVGLHRSLGFELIGVYKRVGWKFGAWQDVAWFHRPLLEAPPGEEKA